RSNRRPLSQQRFTKERPAASRMRPTAPGRRYCDPEPLPLPVPPLAPPPGLPLDSVPLSEPYPPLPEPDPPIPPSDWQPVSAAPREATKTTATKRLSNSIATLLVLIGENPIFAEGGRRANPCHTGWCDATAAARSRLTPVRRGLRRGGGTRQGPRFAGLARRRPQVPLARTAGRRASRR